MCADCSSEAIDMDVMPLRRYLIESTLAQLIKMREKWAAGTEFRESYKAEKLARMSRLIDLKRRLDSNVQSPKAEKPKK